LNLLGLFLAPGDQLSRDIVAQHFKLACALARSPNDSDIHSGLFFIECAFSARLVSDTQARAAARCLILNLQMAFPHPLIFRICYSLCSMVDQFPAHVMAFGQTAIVSILTRYLAARDLPQDDLVSVICAFQRLFHCQDAHLVYLYGDADLIPRLVELVGFPSAFVCRTSLRTLQIALSADPTIGDLLCGGDLLATLAGLVDSEPPFAVLREVQDFAISLIGAVTGDQFVRLLGAPAIARVVARAADLQDEQVGRLAAALEGGAGKCSARGLLPQVWELIGVNGMSESIAAIADVVEQSRPLFRVLLVPDRERP
jgi:hypothetical protein